jgi:putative two-component system response regulator
MRTVLVVDDTPDNIKLLKSVLSPHYQVKVAKSGMRCLEIIRKGELPDLILLDIMMPEMNGYEVCEQLKADERSRDIPVIFVTAKGEIEDEQCGFELGAVDYITKPISAPIVLARVKTHLSLMQLEKYDDLARSAIYMLAEAGHYNDTDTGHHIWRMADYSRALALAAGWSIADAEMLALAATMHDTGKIGIDDTILKAPRKLTDEEWVEMRKHSAIGGSILAKSENRTFKLSSEIALRHHEKWDGSGYPDGLEGESIPQSARIVAIADVFDALSQKRVYKEAMDLDVAFGIIEEGIGNHFDPALAQTFLEIKEEIIAIKEEWDAKRDADVH